MTPEARFSLCQRRLISVLRSHTVANARTLENKIADAGPFDQRIEPHIITPARQALEPNEILRIGGETIWFYLKGTNKDDLQRRLAEQKEVHRKLLIRDFTLRLGQTLEIAIFRTLSDVAGLDFFGAFPDLNEHDDSKLYVKEEPPSNIGSRIIPKRQRLDFLILDAKSGAVGIEAKNIREWLYPNSKEVREVLYKCCCMNAVPVLIARRIPYVTFALLTRCGVILHQMYNQLLPYSEADIAAKAKHKRLLGYHDIRVGNDPDERLKRFFHVNLPKILPEARTRFEKSKDLLYAHAALSISDKDFSAEVLARY